MFLPVPAAGASIGTIAARAQVGAYRGEERVGLGSVHTVGGSIAAINQYVNLRNFHDS